MTHPLQVRVFMINNVKVTFTVNEITSCHIALRGRDFNWEVDTKQELNRTLALTYYNSAIDVVNDNADFDWIGRRSKQTTRIKHLKKKV